MKKGSKSTSIKENTKRRKTTTARLKDDEQIIDMDVGQDSEFMSEESDDESNVIVFKDKITEGSAVNQADSESEEEEDGELREILEVNYQLANLQDQPQDSQNNVVMIRRDSFAVEEKSQIIDEAVNKFQEVFMSSNLVQKTNDLQQQLIDSNRKLEAQSRELERLQRLENARRKEDLPNSKTKGQSGREDRERISKQINEIFSKASDSELTIYKNAVENQISKRESSSSDECFNSSDEIMNVVELDQLGQRQELGQEIDNSLIKQFISDVRMKQRNDGNERMDRDLQQHDNQPQPQPCNSRDGWNRNEIQPTPDDKANEIIRRAERSRLQVHGIPGKSNELKDNKGMNYALDFNKDMVHSVVVDESYQLVASHVDSLTQEKIIKGEYVDFSKLVPKDRILAVDDHRYEMIVKDGKTFWIPANKYEGTQITGYG